MFVAFILVNSAGFFSKEFPSDVYGGELATKLNTLHVRISLLLLAAYVLCLLCLLDPHIRMRLRRERRCICFACGVINYSWYFVALVLILELWMFVFSTAFLVEIKNHGAPYGPFISNYVREIIAILSGLCLFTNFPFWINR